MKNVVKCVGIVTVVAARMMEADGSRRSGDRYVEQFTRTFEVRGPDVGAFLDSLATHPLVLQETTTQEVS